MNLMNSILSIDLEGGLIKIGNLLTLRLDIVYSVIGRIISCIIIGIMMFIAIKLGNKAINRFIERQSESKLKFSLDNKRAYTLGAILKSILKYTVYFIGIAAIIDKLAGGISFAFAGIGGAVIGFGAKDIVNDIANGFFIVFEEQFSVGDHITIDNSYTGIVKEIGLRDTKIEDFNGDVHIMPNGNIKVVTNHSKGSIRMIVDMDIAYEENIDKAIEVLNNECLKFVDDNEDIIECPQVLGVTELKDSSVTIRIVGRVKPLTKLGNEVRLRKLLKEALDANNIEIPYSKIQLVSSECEELI